MFSVIDSDGEFLLIEAAECLPNWANPDNCDQRVTIQFIIYNIIAVNLTLMFFIGLYL